MPTSGPNTFETEALESAHTMKKRLDLESSGNGGKTFEVYRQMVLMERLRGHIH